MEDIFDPEIQSLKVPAKICGALKLDIWRLKTAPLIFIPFITSSA
jgi:hypothetical protein